MSSDEAILSHFFYFVNRIASKILWFDGETVSSYDGNYDDYVNFTAQKAVEKTAAAPKKINDYKKRKELESLERKKKTRLNKLEIMLAQAQSERDELNELLSTPDVAADFERVMELTEKLEKINSDIEEMEIEWLELAE